MRQSPSRKDSIVSRKRQLILLNCRQHQRLFTPSHYTHVYTHTPAPAFTVVLSWEKSSRRGSPLSPATGPLGRAGCKINTCHLSSGENKIRYPGFFLNVVLEFGRLKVKILRASRGKKDTSSLFILNV